MATESRRSSAQQSVNKDEIPNNRPPSGVPVTIVFTDQHLTMAGFADLMRNLEAFLTVGMAQPYELRLPQARARLADSMVITSISKSSPLVMGFDIQEGIQAVTQMISLAGGVIALRPLLAAQLEKAARADLERRKLKLKRKVVDALIMQFDDLPKKKKKKLLGDKRFMKLISRAAEGVLSIDSVSSDVIEAPTATPSTPSDGISVARI